MLFCIYIKNNTLVADFTLLSLPSTELDSLLLQQPPSSVVLPAGLPSPPVFLQLLRMESSDQQL